MPAVFDMTLASKRYVLAGPVVREPIPDLAQQWRSGAPDYSDRQGAQYYEWDDLSGGFGLDMIDCKKDEHRRRSWIHWDIDTRWPGTVILGPLLSDMALTPQPSLPQYGRFLDIPGALLFVSQATSWKAAVWRNSATTWNQVYGATQANANLGRSWRFPVPNDIEQDMYLGTGGGLYRSPIGGTSFAACGTSFAARGLGYDFGEETLLCQKTKDDGKLYTITGHPTTPVATAIGYLGGLVGDMVTFYDQDGALVPYISVFKAPTSDNAGKPLASLYRVDLLEEKVYPVSDAPPAVNAPASGQTWKNVIVWNGWLYLFLGHDLYRYQPGRWEPVPLSKADFVPWGLGDVYITGMTKAANWLYVAMTTGTDLYLFAVGQDGSWHCLLSASTLGTDLCLSDDWTPARLWLTTGTTTRYLSYIATPDGPDNPLEISTYIYKDIGVLRLPWFGGWFPELEGTALRLSVLADGLSATEVIPVYYRTVRGGTWTGLGDINSTTGYFDFASGVGAAFKIIQFELDLSRGIDTTKTPVIRRIVFTYLKKPPIRYRYTAAIEVKATRTALRSIETLLAEFETVYNATTLQQLKYGRVSTYINLTAINFIERPPATKTGQRNVYQIQLVMEEPI